MNLLSFVIANVPMPRDLMLPLPLFEEHLKLLLVFFFLIHIFFVNLMVGGSLQTWIFECLGLKNPKYDKLARKIAETVTVNKSLAAVFGVGPILCISLVYTSEFYAANALTGHAWFALIPLITAAFLLTYLHKYTWDAWIGPRKKQHVLLGATASLIFLIIPIIFLSNINLMLFPDSWSQVRGFISSLKIGNVLPRYFHFLTACNAVTALFLAGWFGRQSYPAVNLPDFTKAGIRRLFYEVAFYCTMAQFIFGPLLLLTLPHKGMSRDLVYLILTGAAFAILLLYVLSKEIHSEDNKIGQWYWPIVSLFTVIVFMMGTGRHLYRETSLYEYRMLIQKKTDEFRAIEVAAHMSLKAGLGAGRDKNLPPTGKMLFKQACATCHAQEKILVGPPIKEIYQIYHDNPDGIVSWATAPGKKRAGFPQMQPLAYLGNEKLKLIAQYMLEVGEGKKRLDDPGDE